MEQRRIGIIGLGLMGTALTERLLEAGYEVVVFNRTRERATRLLAQGARWSDNPLTECDRVLISLFNSDTVEEVLNQLGSVLRPGQVLIDTTTGSPEQTELLGQALAARGVIYLDAPISGSSEQTRRGDVTIIVGGEPASFEACRDLFEHCGRTTIYAGRCGSGSRMKLVTNLVLGLNRAALAEGLVFAEALGIDPSAALQVLSNSIAYSRTMDTKGQKMIEGDFRVQARLAQHAKDVRLILEAATRAGQALPLSETHLTLLNKAEQAGFGDADNSAVIQAYRAAKRA